MNNPVYLDYAATTPVAPQVAEKMARCLTADGVFGNPASISHFVGAQASAYVEQAREQVAALLQADTREIVFTAGATEADNLAIKGVARGYAHKGRHIITSAIEHKAVLDTCRYLETCGYEVTWLQPDAKGCHSAAQVEAALRADTILVSLMWVNNETGSINPVAEIGAVCRAHKVLFHVDAAQAAGKLATDVPGSGIDLLSLSAHKFYGPKGAGALYVRRRPRIRLTPLLHGGGHERGYRSGTLATHQIVGLGEACALAIQQQARNLAHVSALRQRLLNGLQQLEGVALNSPENGYPGIVNIRFEGVDGEALLMALNRLALSSGSACNSAARESSYVLRGLGLGEQQADQSLRISFGQPTTEAEIDTAIEQITTHVVTLRQLSTTCDRYQA